MLDNSYGQKSNLVKKIMTKFSFNNLFSSVRGQLPQVLLFVQQGLLERYKGSLLGVAWVFIQPLAYILIFSLVFSTLMKARMVGFEDQPLAYTKYLVSGLLIWMFMSNTLVQLSSVYQTKASIIHKLPVSLSIMPIHIVIIEAIVYFLSMIFFALILLVMGENFSWHWLLLPLVLLVSILVVYPLGLIIAMVGVFIPDIRTATPIVMQLLFWLTPIVYLASILPLAVQEWLVFNPFYWMTDSVQRIVLYQQYPQAGLVMISVITAVLLLLIARYLQHKLEKDIRDLI